MGRSLQLEMGESSSSTSNLVTKTRQASKVTLILAVLLIIFLVLTIVFVVLYVNEEDGDGAANIGDKEGRGGGNITTSKPTASPTQAQTQSCEDTSCVISAGGRRFCTSFII